MAKVRITIYDVSEKILSMFDSELAAAATKRFLRQGIEIRTKAFIQKVEGNALVLKSGEVIPFGACVWSTGLAPNTLTSSVISHLECDKSGRILTDDKLRAIGKDGAVLDGVYALGDCATIKEQYLPVYLYNFRPQRKLQTRRAYTFEMHSTVCHAAKVRRASSRMFISTWE
jgi:NADH dehydrogenase FAD-containing subunit